MKRQLPALLFTALLYGVQARADVMVGAYVPGDGFSKEEIANLNSVLEKPLSFINIFSSFSHDWDHLYWQTSNIVSENATPMISWMPVDLSRPDANLLGEIVLGDWDGYIDQWISKFGAWLNSYPELEQPTIMIRFAHEFNGPWYAYGDSPAMFKAAWTYVHDRFTSAGLNNNVEWVWCADTIDVDQYDNITTYYPGDDYVDWTSLDGYNWGTNHDFTTWENFNEIYANQYLELVNNYPSKPIMIAEFGSAEELDLPNPDFGQMGDNSDVLQSKSEWLRTMLTQLEQQFPAVRAISLFNIDHELSWSLTGAESTGLDAFNAGLASEHYASSFITTLNVSLDLSLEDLQAQSNAEKLAAERDARDAELANILDQISLQENVVDVAAQDLLSSANAYRLHKAEFLDKRDVVRENRKKLLEGNDALYTSIRNFRESLNLLRTARTEFFNSRISFHDIRTNFYAAKTSYSAAQNKYNELVDAEKKDYFQTYIDKRNSYRSSRDSFLAKRDSYLEKLSEFRNSRSELNIQRGILTEHRQVANSTRVEYRSSTSGLIAVHENFIAAKNNFLQTRTRRDSAKEELEALQLNYNTLNESLGSTLVIALDDGSEGILMRDSDSSRSDKEEDKDDNDENEDENDENDSAEEIDDDDEENEDEREKTKNVKKFKKLKVNKNTQIAMALSAQPQKIAKEKVNKKANGFRNMNAQQRRKIKSEKLSTLSY